MDVSEEAKRSPLKAILNYGSFNLPKGNWTKQLKSIPTNFNDSIIHDHHATRNSLKHKIKGYRMFKAKRVSNVLISHEKSKVQKIYNVHIVLDSTKGNVKYGSCECKSGKIGVCCHVAATLWFIYDCVREGWTFIPNDVSPTEEAQKWGKLNVKKNLSTTKFSVLKFQKFTPGKKDSNRKSRKSCVAKYSSLSIGKRPMWQQILHEANHTPVEFKAISYVSNPDPPNNLSQIEKRQRIKLPALEIVSERENEFPEALKVTFEEARLIEENTRGQSTSQLWRTERRERLTASNFGQIVKRRAKITPKFLESMRGSVDISRMKYVREGLENEAIALKKYCTLEKKEKVQAFKVGLVINPGFPVLGASPDNLIYDEETQDFGLLEIKTLSKVKELGLTIDEAVTSKDLKLSICLKKDAHGKIFLNRTHNY